MKLKNNLPEGFNDPIELPKSQAQAEKWQESNYEWWQSHPMRYDWKDKVPYEEFSKEFYAEIDRRHFLNTMEYMGWKLIPFDNLIDFNFLKNKDVLEIGVGNGSHAQLFAQHSKSFTGIDLTEDRKSVV